MNNTPASPMELFDLDVNVGKEYNIAGKYPEVVKKMEKFMREAHNKNPDWPLLPGEK